VILKIEKDHSRFRQIVKGKIKKDLRKYISRGEMIGRKGKDIVSIPVPQISLRTSDTASRELGESDRARGRPGLPLGPQGRAGRAGRGRPPVSTFWRWT